MQALILHLRAYRETSALVDFFTDQYGLVRAVLRTAKNKNGSCAQPFCLLDLELRGKKELKSVQSLSINKNFMLQGKALFCGIYLNELLLRLLPSAETNVTIFKSYKQTLHSLQNNIAKEPCLREFEQLLLRELGYALVLDFDLEGKQIKENAYYQFDPIAGFKLMGFTEHKNLILGTHLLAIKATNWNLPQVLNSAKKIMRQALAVHLGTKPLLSRNLFIS